ncbi:MAG: hypothetical protein JXA57_05700 [Armatimonadetes bacterium]|nr:hypothetical protein [Armatimonadota bacterium]
MRVSPGWPSLREDQSALFTGRPPFRKIGVLIDGALFTGLESISWSRDRLLFDLLQHPFVECYRYAEDGPPLGLQARTDFDGKEYFPGWAVVSEGSLPTPRFPRGVRGVRYIRDNSLISAGIYKNAPEHAARDVSTGASVEYPAEIASARREADALAALVGEAIGADLFVTDRRFLHESTWKVAETGICSPGEALIILGLYLRAQGQFVVSQSRSTTLTVSRGSYYSSAARELLTLSERMLVACGQHTQESDDDGPTLLMWLAIDRLGRALLCRDEVHLSLCRSQRADAADEALRAFDGFALWLVGAFDAIGRLVHTALGLTGSVRDVSWRRGSWTKKVREAAPDLGAIVERGSPGERTLTILGTLRNSVHGEATVSVLVSGGSATRAWVQVSREDSRVLQSAFASLGGEAAWGVRFSADERLYIDPTTLVEKLLRSALSLLNNILEMTPIERLCSAGIHDLDRVRIDPDQEPHTEKNRQSIVWQLGF